MIRLFKIASLSLIFLTVTTVSHALTLEEGLSAVVDKGRDVRIARYSEDAARAFLSLAKSPWLPQISIYGNETWLQYRPEAKTSFGAFPMSQDQFLTYGMKATQLLYDFGRTSSTVEAARFRLTSREAETGSTMGRVALDFVSAYLDLLEADKLLLVAKKEVQRYEAHKKDAEARLRAGVATKNEVLQTEVTLADSRQRLLTAENVLSLKESRINSLLLKPLNDPVEPEEINTTPSAGLTLEEAWASAEGRPGIKDMNAKIAAKEESIKALNAEYMPIFYLSGGYEYSENEYMVHQDNWSAVVGVSINLYSGGASSSRLSMEKAELRSLNLSRDKLLDAIRLDVKSAYLDLQSSKQKIDVANTAIAQAEENLRLQRLRYKEGVGTATDVLDAVTLLTNAETNSWKALYGFKHAEATFLNAAGKNLVELYGK